MLSVLPQEILESIVEDVDSSKLNTLCLVCRSLRAPVQRRRFRTLRLKDKEGTNRALKPLCLLTLCEILTLNPALISYIRNLELLPSISFIGSSLTVSANLLTATFRLLSSSPIQTLRFSSNTPLQWSRIQQNIQNALFMIFRNPAFQTLELDGLIMPRHFFAKVANLQRLTVHQNNTFISSTDFSDMTRTMKSYSHTLKHLTISLPRLSLTTTNHHFNVDPIGPQFGIELSHLQSLDLSFHFDQLPAVARFLQLKRLRSLAISVIPTTKSTSEPTVPLNALINLHHLTLTQNLFSRWTKDSLTWIGYTLATLTSLSLQVLTIKFGVHPINLTAGGFKSLEPLAGYLEMVSNNMRMQCQGPGSKPHNEDRITISASEQRGLRVHDQNQVAPIPLQGGYLSSTLSSYQPLKGNSVSAVIRGTTMTEGSTSPRAQETKFRIRLEFNVLGSDNVPATVMVKFSEDVRKKVKWVGSDDVLESVIITPG
ncbi:hypothetical protein BDN72DRAFT_844738 [Pluteus cervinus]|uniref:Uncharacterized protein n=1 Tax=Pluteus cervinus TaxID=181527 RepID=A0ACD3AMH9_9AGAR|nr:hypothetical protein BDN72DRAFT_844738 [Pluteus cervinus]